MSNYRSTWARNFSNPLNRRKGESHSHHQYRTARYYVAVITLVALAVMAWTKDVPECSVNTESGNVHFHGARNLSNLAP